MNKRGWLLKDNSIIWCSTYHHLDILLENKKKFKFIDFASDWNNIIKQAIDNGLIRIAIDDIDKIFDAEGKRECLYDKYNILKSMTPDGYKLIMVKS